MKIICITAFIVVFFAGCYYDKAQLIYPSTGICDTLNVTYSIKVAAILNANCYTCHSGTATAGASIKLDTYSNLKVYVTNGQLLNSINQTGGIPAMPLNAAKLSECETKAITVWINNGSSNN